MAAWNVHDITGNLSIKDPFPFFPLFLSSRPPSFHLSRHFLCSSSLSVNPQAKDSDLALLANIPLALLDSSLCWWISFGVIHKLALLCF